MLRSLELINCSVQFAATLPESLVSLILRNVRFNAEDDDEVWIDAEPCKTLRHLELILPEGDLDERVYLPWDYLEELRDLIYDTFNSNLEFDVSILDYCPNLERLKLIGQTGITYNEFQMAEDGNMEYDFSEMKQLTVLDLSRATFYGSPPPNLEKLYLPCYHCDAARVFWEGLRPCKETLKEVFMMIGAAKKKPKLKGFKCLKRIRFIPCRNCNGESREFPPMMQMVPPPGFLPPGLGVSNFGVVPQGDAGIEFMRRFLMGGMGEF